MTTPPPSPLRRRACQWRHFLYALQFTWPKASPTKNLCQGFYLNGIIFSCPPCLISPPQPLWIRPAPWRCPNIFRSHLNCSFLFAPSVPVLGGVFPFNLFISLMAFAGWPRWGLVLHFLSGPTSLLLLMHGTHTHTHTHTNTNKHSHIYVRVPS